MAGRWACLAILRIPSSKCDAGSPSGASLEPFFEMRSREDGIQVTVVDVGVPVLNKR